jgi:hypothetical protein
MFHRRVAKQQTAASRNPQAGACEFPEASVTAHDNDRQCGLISARDIGATTLGRDDDLSATLNAARGIVVALVIGVVLWSVWIGLGLWAWYLLRR